MTSAEYLIKAVKEHFSQQKGRKANTLSSLGTAKVTGEELVDGQAGLRHTSADNTQIILYAFPKRKNRVPNKKKLQVPKKRRR